MYSSYSTPEASQAAFGNRPADCNKMNDGTYSWEQPASQGIFGYEGRCGQTAVANMLTIRGTKWTSPDRVINTAWDRTPGSRPSTVLSACRKLGPNRGTPDFKLTYHDSLSDVRLDRPIVVLLQWDSFQLHWVAVVSASSSTVKFNHWGRQQSMGRKEFDRRWSLKGASWLQSVGRRLGVISANTAVRPRT